MTNIMSERARRLRKEKTVAERNLWRKLRELNAQGFHFRQQAPVGPYIADFADLSAKLVVEADGSQHGLTEGAKRDAGRTRWLEGQGFKVLRFWNNDVLTNIDGVMTSILVGLGVLQDEPVVDQSSERIALTPTHSPSSAETGIGGKRVATQ